MNTNIDSMHETVTAFPSGDKNLVYLYTEDRVAMNRLLFQLDQHAQTRHEIDAERNGFMRVGIPRTWLLCDVLNIVVKAALKVSTQYRGALFFATARTVPQDKPF